MSPRLRQLLPAVPALRDARLMQWAAAFLAIGTLFCALELITLGTVTAPALGLEVIGAALLPIGVIAMLTAPGRFGRGDAPGGDDGHGDDGGHDDPDPLPPTGGLEIDWASFEREFRAYAEAVTVSDDAFVSV